MPVVFPVWLRTAPLAMFLPLAVPLLVLRLPTGLPLSALVMLAALCEIFDDKACLLADRSPMPECWLFKEDPLSPSDSALSALRKELVELCEP